MQLVKIIIAGDFVHLKSLQVEEGAQAVITSENIKVLYNAQSNNKNMWRTLYASQDDNLIILCSNIENGKIKNNNYENTTLCASCRSSPTLRRWESLMVRRPHINSNFKF